MRRCPIRSAIAPVSGAEKAEEKVRKPRNSPDANVDPPRSMMWNGAVGSSGHAERKTVNVNPHITKKRGVNSRLGDMTYDGTTGFAVRSSRLAVRGSGSLLTLQHDNRIDP